MNTAIIYSSNHHGNTKKLLDAIADNADVTLVDVANMPQTDLNAYDCIGFASGVYFSKYHKTLLDFARQNLPNGKKVFFIHTAGDPRENQNAAIKSITDEKECVCLGTFFCKGYDTYGPFKLIGGIAKGHPNEQDLRNAVAFFKNL